MGRSDAALNLCDVVVRVSFERFSGRGVDGLHRPIHSPPQQPGSTARPTTATATLRGVSTLALFPEGTSVHEHTLANGLRVRWYEKGEGPVILCLHGFPELAVSFRRQVAGLSDRYRVVAPDMRGYGGTDAPAEVNEYSLERLMDDVEGMIEALDERTVHLVGHDWGGALAWQMAQERGHQLRSLTVLNCPPVALMSRQIVNPAQLRRSWYIFFFQLPRLPEKWLLSDPQATAQRMFHGGALNREPFDDESLAPYVEQMRERGLPGLNYYRAIGRRPRIRLRPIEVPTRLVWGMGDPALGTQFADPAKYRSWVRDFDLVRVPEAGHWVQQEAPEVVNRAIREHVERVEEDRRPRAARAADPAGR